MGPEYIYATSFNKDDKLAFIHEYISLRIKNDVNRSEVLKDLVAEAIEAWKLIVS